MKTEREIRQALENEERLRKERATYAWTREQNIQSLSWIECLKWVLKDDDE